MNLDSAACTYADRHLFFGADGEPDWALRWREKRAKAICASCPLREACLSVALAEGYTSGVWGGLGEQEITNLRKSIASRARAARTADAAASKRARIVAVGEKPCTNCGEVKPLGEFSPKGDWYAPWCRDCRRADWHKRQVAAA
jgi:WhiB family redox-sensing transcriptional regulator